MRTHLQKIAIPKPCQQEWSAMDDHLHSKFCQSCQKAVVDMRSLTDDQIIALVSSGNKVCGHIGKAQLTRLNHNLPSPQDLVSFRSLFKIAAGLAAFLSVGSVTAKPIYKTEQHPMNSRSSAISGPDTVVNKLISGSVTDKDGFPLPGVSIQLKDTKYSTFTDSTGRFKLWVRSNEDVLQLRYVGFEHADVRVKNLKGQDGTITLKLVETVLGEMVAIRPSLYKRVLWRLKHPFKGLF